MIHAMAGAQAIRGRRVIKSNGTGEEHWRTDFLGARSDGEIRKKPQAFLIEMHADETIVPHFHAVDQFQVFVAGSGGLGRSNDAANPIAVHYADRYTGYGPILAGPQGYSYFTLRANSDSGAVYLHEPGYREKLKPSKKRHYMVHGLTLSTEPVLRNRREAALEALFENQQQDVRGPAAWMLRLGPDMALRGPASRGGGQYYLVANGSLECEGASYAAWSTLFLDPADDALDVRAGNGGLEALVLGFPGADA
jgi:hypothetical protein